MEDLGNMRDCGGLDCNLQQYQYYYDHKVLPAWAAQAEADRAAYEASLTYGCGLPLDIDPDDLCEVDANGYATLDVDQYLEKTSDHYHSEFSRYGHPKMMLQLATKGEHTDQQGQVHPGTYSDLVWSDLDHRFVLGCPQRMGVKTLRFTVKRPKSISEFGGEWISLYPKDSWLNLTTEFEPYTYNPYGAKIPIASLRNISELAAEYSIDESVGGEAAATTEYAHFYGEVSNAGDYEIRYGNPNFKINGKWVAIEFRKTLLRIGTPFSDCGDLYEAAPNKLDLGMVIPAFYENPALNQAMYYKTIGDLQGTTSPTTVAIRIFTQNDEEDQIKPGGFWTDSLAPETHKYASAFRTDYYTSCYRAGTPCPEDHAVCKPEYCHVDRFRQIIADMKAASPWVNVLGVIDVSRTTNWDKDVSSVAEHRQRLNGTAYLDGFFFDRVPHNEQKLRDLMDVIAQHIDQANRSACIAERTCTHINHKDQKVFGLYAPLFNRFAVTHPGAPDIWVTMYTHWRSLGVWTPYSWYPGMIPNKWAAMVFGAPTSQLSELMAVLYDRGYGNIFIHSGIDVNKPTDHFFFADQALRQVGRDNARRLASAEVNGDDEMRNPSWACDDTRFTCAPICIQTAGKVTVKVQKARCTELHGAADPCPCNDVCYYDVHWDKQGNDIRCIATQKGEEREVGDMVCEFRGSRKPTPEQWGSPEVQRGTRGTFPENMEKCTPAVVELEYINSLGTGTLLAATVWLLA